MSEFTNLRVDAVNSYYNDFGNEQENFNNSARSFFNSSYFYFNNDDIVVKMRRNLESKYNRINTGYSKIRDWWGSYLRDARAVETVLSHDGGYINSMLVDNKVRMLRELLSEYDENNDNFVYFNLSKKSKYTLKGMPEYANTDTEDPIYELMNYGFLRTDIIRVLRGEISAEDLYKEIETEPDNSRRKMLYSAEVLESIRKQAGIDYGHSITDLENALKADKLALKKMNDEYSNYSYRMQELDGVGYILQCMINGNNYNLDDILKNSHATFGNTWVDADGNKFYVSSKLADVSCMKSHSTDTAVDISQFANSTLVAEIRQIIGNKKGYEFDKETISKLNQLYEKVQKEQQTMLKDTGITTLHDEILKKSITVSDQKQIYAEINSQINYYFTNIDPYVTKKDFADKSTSNTVGFDKKMIYKYIDNSASNDEILRLDRITDKNEQLQVISAILNNELDTKNTWQAEKKKKPGETIEFAEYNSIIEGYEVAGDGIISRFAKWKLVISDEEIKCFNYIYKDKGSDAAYTYLNNISQDLDQRYLYKRKQLDENWAHEHHVAASVESVLITPAEGLHAGYMSLKYLVTDSPLYRTSIYSKGTVERGAVSVDMHEKSNFVGTIYDCGMSIADTAILMVMNKGIPGSSIILSPALMGSRSYGSTLNDALDRGVDVTSAISLATASAIVESAMEHYSTSHLLKIEDGAKKMVGGALEKLANSGLSQTEIKFASGFISFLGNTVTQAFCEADEELCTGIIEYVTDEMISEDLSNHTLAFQNYLKAGYSVEEARKMADNDTLMSLKEDFMGGLYSGVFFGGLESAAKTHEICNKMAHDFFMKNGGVDTNNFASTTMSAKKVIKKIGEANYQNLGSQISSLIAENCNDVGLDIRISNLGVNSNVSLEQSYNAISDVLKIADNAADTDSFLGIHRAGAMAGNEAQFFERGIIISGHTGNAGIELTKQSDVKTQSDLVDVLGTNISFENLKLNGVDSNGNVELDNNCKGKVLSEIATGGGYKNYLDDGTIMIVSIPKTATDAYIQDQKGTYVLNTKYIVGYVTTNVANNSIDSFTMNPNFYNQSILGESTTVEHGAEVKNNINEIVESNPSNQMGNVNTEEAGILAKNNAEIKEEFANYDAKTKNSIRQAAVNDLYNRAIAKAKKLYNDFFKNFREHAQMHVKAVSDYAVAKAQEANLSAQAIEEVRVAGLYHDLGMNGGVFKSDITGQYYNIDDLVMTKETFYDVDKKGNKVVMRKYTINGEHVYSAAASDSESLTKANIARSNHPLNSALEILAYDLSPEGVDNDIVALLALSHSKSTSGIKDFASEEQWMKAIEEKLIPAVKAYDSSIDADAIEARLKAKINSADIKTLQAQALAVRDGDAMAEPAYDENGNLLMQAGTSSKITHHYQLADDSQIPDVDSAAKEASKYIIDTLVDAKTGEFKENINNAFSVKVHAGEGNVDHASSYDGKSYVANLTIKSGLIDPNSSLDAIYESLGEIATYTNTESREAIIHVKDVSPDSPLAKWYEAQITKRNINQLTDAVENELYGAASFYESNIKIVFEGSSTNTSNRINVAKVEEIVESNPSNQMGNANTEEAGILAKNNAEIKEEFANYDAKTKNSIRQAAVNDLYNRAIAKAKKLYNDFFKNFREHAQMHVKAVSDYAVAKAQEANLSAQAIEEVRVAGLYHDLGMNGGVFKSDITGQYYNIDDLVMTKETFYDVDKKGNKVVMRKYTINGEHVYSAAASDSESLTKANIARSNHPLNSALEILAYDLSPEGVDNDIVALLALSHSKSTSGIKDFASEEQWMKAIEEKLIPAVKAYDSSIDADAIEARLKAKINSADIKTLQAQALAVRDGDAMAEPAYDENGNLLMQAGTSSKITHHYQLADDSQIPDVDSAAKEASKYIIDTLVDAKTGEFKENINNAFSVKVHAGEGNVDHASSYDGKSYVANLTIKSGLIDPNSSLDAIYESLGEIATYTNTESREAIIHVKDVSPDSPLAKWYEAQITKRNINQLTDAVENELYGAASFYESNIKIVFEGIPSNWIID